MVGRSHDGDDRQRVPTGMRLLALLLVLDATVWRMRRRLMRRPK